MSAEYQEDIGLNETITEVSRLTVADVTGLLQKLLV